jgi:PAS domain S-box-containing protein
LPDSSKPLRSGRFRIWIDRGHSCGIELLPSSTKPAETRVTGIVTDITAGQLARQELATANERLHLAMDAGKTVGWDWDVKSGTDSWFGDLQTIFGIPSKTYFGHVEDFRRRVHPDDRALVWQAVKHAMESQSPYVAEFRIIREDGSIRWVAAQGKFYYLSNGEAERMMGIAVDITDRKIAEEILHQKDIELALTERLAKGEVGNGTRWGQVTWSDELYRIAGRDPVCLAREEHSQLYTSESWNSLRVQLRAPSVWNCVELVGDDPPDGSTRWLIAAANQRDRKDESDFAVRFRTSRNAGSRKTPRVKAKNVCGLRPRLDGCMRTSGTGKPT